MWCATVGPHRSHLPQLLFKWEASLSFSPHIWMEDINRGRCAEQSTFSHLFYNLTDLKAKTTAVWFAVKWGKCGSGESHSTICSVQAALPADRLMSCNQPSYSDWAILWQWLVIYVGGIVRLGYLKLKLRMSIFLLALKHLFGFCWQLSMWMYLGEKHRELLHTCSWHLM